MAGGGNTKKRETGLVLFNAALNICPGPEIPELIEIYSNCKAQIIRPRITFMPYKHKCQPAIIVRATLSLRFAAHSSASGFEATAVHSMLCIWSEEEAAWCIFPERLSVRKQKFKFSEYQPFLSRAPGARCLAWLVPRSGWGWGWRIMITRPALDNVKKWSPFTF